MQNELHDGQQSRFHSWISVLFKSWPKYIIQHGSICMKIQLGRFNQIEQKNLVSDKNKMTIVSGGMCLTMCSKLISLWHLNILQLSLISKLKLSSNNVRNLNFLFSAFLCEYVYCCMNIILFILNFKIIFIFSSTGGNLCSQFYWKMFLMVTGKWLSIYC